MEKNSVAMEKGTLNTQCMYKQNKKTFQHEQLYCRIKNNNQKTVNLHLMEKKNQQTNQKTKFTSIQIQNIFLLSTMQYLEMHFNTWIGSASREQSHK